MLVRIFYPEVDLFSPRNWQFSPFFFPCGVSLKVLGWEMSFRTVLGPEQIYSCQSCTIALYLSPPSFQLGELFQHQFTDKSASIGLDVDFPL